MGAASKLALAMMVVGSACGHEAAAASAPCRWSWKSLRCVDPSNNPASCTFSLKRFRCAPKAGRESPPTAAASKASQSKVTPPKQATTHSAAAAQQQQQQQQQQQPAAAQQQQQPAQQKPARPGTQQQPQPQTPPAWLTSLQRAMGLQQADRWAEAATAYEAALAAATSFRSEQERVQVLYTANTNLGLALQNTKRPAEAAVAFGKAVAVVPNNADGHHNLGNALYKSGEHGKASAAYERAIELQPTDGESYFGLGNCHDKLGDAGKASAAFAASLALNPSDDSSMYNLANAYRTLGRTEEALQLYRAALRATPTNAAMHANLAHALDASGHYTEATASFTRALELSPRDAATYTALGHAYKSNDQIDRAVDAYKQALALEPNAAGAYAGLGTALKQIDPKGAAEAFAAASKGGGSGPEAEAAREFRKWLDATPPPPPLPSPRIGGARAWATVAAAARYPPELEERAKGCPVMTMAEAVSMGSEKLLAQGPTLLRNASVGWKLHGAISSGDGDAALAGEVGDSAMRMLVMPTDVHPTLDPPNKALVEPAASGIYFKDYLRLLDRLRKTEEFAVYVAQMNLLRLPQILRQVCLPEALPASKLTMANLWVGGHSMKNGLHFDVFDNLLHQLSGRKRALLFPPSDTPHLYYALESGANIRRHSFSLEGGKGFSNETVHEAVRKNVAVIDVFDDAVAGSHPAIAHATPYVCELAEGDALFLPKNWHHAVISSAEHARNVAVNTWYDLRGGTTPLSRVSDLKELFQAEGCEAPQPA